MSVEIKVPTLGESITEATVGKWFVKEGDSFNIDEPLVEIETDKITLEVSAPSSGMLEKIKVLEGNEVQVGGVLGLINESKKVMKNTPNKIVKTDEEAETKFEKEIIDDKSKNNIPSPSARKIIEENNLDISKINLSRNDGKITKTDLINFIDKKESKAVNKKEEIVKMSRIRKTISSRLKEAQNTAAILTTFNEVDMSSIIKIRDSKKESFYKEHGVKLGFMSFFVKAVIEALNEYPAVNAEIKNEDIIYKNYFHIGIAVGTEDGLVVPVIKNANNLDFGQIEKTIDELSSKARNGKLSIDDLSGGTFTISNGGIYGSMLSTPIINRPQSGILGMHNIVNRPVVIDNEIVVRPIMYLALSYDHRLIDGKEAVSFLLLVKKNLENPSKMILGI